MSRAYQRTTVPLAALLVALSLLVVGCAGTFRSPAHGGPQWVELSSEHFVVESDLDVDIATQTLQALEAFREALETIAFPSESQPIGRTRLVIFRRVDEYVEIGPQGSDGYFTPRGNLLDPEPRAVLYAESHTFGRNIQHELVHRYVAFHFPAAPIWLNEGLAEFYSTLALKDGMALAGESPSVFY